MLNKHNIYQDYKKVYLVEKELEKVEQAKYELARACWYTMMDQGMSWEEMFVPLLVNLPGNGKVEEAFKSLLAAMDEEGLPDLHERWKKFM